MIQIKFLQDKNTEWVQELNLKGRIKTVTIDNYYAIIKSNALLKGERIKQHFGSSDLDNLFSGLNKKISFNKNGQIVEKIILNGESIINKYHYDYDNKGLLCKEITFDVKTNSSFESKSFKYNSLGQLIEKITPHIMGVKYDYYVYDVEGTLIEYNYIRTTDGPKEKYSGKLIYNDGRLIEIQSEPKEIFKLITPVTLLNTLFTQIIN